MNIAAFLTVLLTEVAIGNSAVVISSSEHMKVFIGQGLSPQTTSFVTLSSPVDLACVYACLTYNSVYNSPCYAAQYISGSNTCLLQVSCTTVLLASNSTSKTYLMILSTIQRSKLVLPLTNTCSTSQTAQYGSADLTVTQIGTRTATSSNVTSINGAITYPTSTSPTSYTMVNDTSQSGALNVLAGDFTISFAYKYTTAQTGCYSHPMLKFLGAANGSQCMTFATGCCNSCTLLMIWNSCSCVNPATGTGGGGATKSYSSTTVNHNYYTHTTFVYKFSAQTMFSYVNGTLLSTWTSVTFSPATSQYRVMVGAVECYYGWGNQFPGSIACLAVSTSAFGNQDVKLLHKQCLQQQGVTFN